MNLQKGMRLGPYEVIAPIGAGGMGEVYRARDTRLERDVALKVLPAELAASPQFQLRLDREAKTISQINHPHICTLYDIGSENGTNYLVMELLEGESLADKLAHGRLSIQHLLQYGVQIAEALDKAHRLGIVHRDLKPGNIMITKSGAKLLDFGLAKPVQPSLGASHSVLMTEKKPITEQGAIVGTYQYMAPEQLEGIEADARTDIFALGTVLYEMATGKRAFEGKTRTSIIAAIVSSDPAPISQIQPLTPPALEHVIGKCLAKDPDERWQSAQDIASELRWIGDAGSQAGIARPRRDSRKWRERSLWIAAIAIAAATAAVATRSFTDAPRETPPAFRADLDLQPPLFYGTVARPFDISPDGKWLAYVAATDAADHLYLRRLDQSRATLVPQTRGARTPFFSPDGRFIGFQTGPRWKIIPVDGGPAQTLTECECWSPSWSQSGVILFASDRGIERVPVGGGTAETIIPAPKNALLTAPLLLPDGKTVILTIDVMKLESENELAKYDLETKQLTRLGPGASAEYLDSGHLLYAHGSSLVTRKFDLGTLQFQGPPVTAVESVARHPGTRESFHSFSPAGFLAYMSGATSYTDSRPVWIDRGGRAETIPLPPRAYAHPRISPDGRSAVLVIREAATDVWALNVARNTLSRLTFVPIENEMPLWMPTGRDVLYSSSRKDEPRVHMMRAADGSGAEKKLFSANIHQHLTSISPDGARLLLTEFHPDTGPDVWLMSIDGKERRPLMATRFDEMNAQFSPNGKWIAYTSMESGQHEVYVVGALGGGKWQVSTEGGQNPVWSRDGRELYYISGRRMFVVDVTATSSFSLSVPRLLFEADFELLPRGDTNYDVSPDGKRFLMIQTDRSATKRPLTVVSNWFVR